MSGQVLSLPTKRCGALAHVGERVLPITAFYANRRAADGRQPYCSACDRARSSKRLVGQGGPKIPHRVQNAASAPEEDDIEETERLEDLESGERWQRFLMWRAYEMAGGRQLGGTKQTDHVLDEVEIVRWSNEVASELRAGKSLDEALAIANADLPDWGPEDRPVGVEAPHRPPTRLELVSSPGPYGGRPVEGKRLDDWVEKNAAAALDRGTDTDALALDIAGLMPELGSNVPERRLGPRKLQAVRRADLETEAHRLARERAKPWARPSVPVSPLDQVVLAELARRSVAQAYDLQGDGPLDVDLDAIRDSLKRLEKRGLVEARGRGRVVLWKASRPELVKGDAP